MDDLHEIVWKFSSRKDFENLCSGQLSTMSQKCHLRLARLIGMQVYLQTLLLLLITDLH